ncbi:hypothetical protein [Bradyrhizobium sp. cf659]|uniref:hypothetical protein n=1 Tax=Bradyrhizobium sp. cf659 TaxID=1761771 RepID=UPI0008F0767B|nr:hypothetical protein [Bradyrhizobium sp. cf659]SFI02506.1 hypothetical protein SAMN04487925_1011608 [Bradyrhizobium sp. cf659]
MNSRKIAPEFSFRFTAEDIRHAYGSADTAFARGDFLNVAQMAPADSELRGCALILGGLLEQGLALLDGLTAVGDRARLCRALAFWSLKRDAEADAELAKVGGAEFMPAATAFRTLIKRDDVTIFVPGAILSVFPEHYSETFVAPVYKYGSITVKYVGSQLASNAYDYSPTDSFSEFIDDLPEGERPDLIFSLSPQWLVAKDFHKVTVPKVIWCHDSDAFQYRNADNYALYDVAICNCSQEHFELSQGTPGLYCAANMLLHPIATPFPEASPHREKLVDIIFTGSALAPFHSEKPRFLFNLSSLAPRYKVKVIEGHMPEKEYFEVVSHAKFLPIVNRYAGSPSPRWRDALSNGAFLLFPEGSFYDEIAPGCYSFRAETMTADIAGHLDRCAAGHPDYEFATVVPVVNERFAIHREPREESYQRLLKYALFMGLVWPYATPVPKRQRQRRLVWLTPAVDCGCFGTDHIREQIADFGGKVGPDDLSDEIDYNNAAHLHAQAVFTFHENRSAGKWAARADQYFREGLARFPNSLLLRFNEAHWSFFRPGADFRATEKKFLDIIDRGEELIFDPRGADVAFAYTLHGNDEVFPCYEYADVATSELVLENTPELRDRKQLPYSTRDMIIAACYGYVGWARLKRNDNEGGVAWLRRGTELYPHGLPMLRLHFDTLLRLAAKVPKLPASLASDLAESFIAVANVNPSILLTHVYTIVPILAENGERQAAREVLAGWHQLSNIVHKLRVDDEAHQLALYGLLWNHRSLLPKTLLDRIDEALWDMESVQDLTQLERRMIEVARISNSPERKRKWWSLRSAKAQADDQIARLLAESGYGQERVVFSSILRAIEIWLRAPSDVRWIYLKKAVRLGLRGDFKQALVRTQKWSAVSKWSKGEGLNARPRPRRWGISSLRMWLTRLGRGPVRRE